MFVDLVLEFTAIVLSADDTVQLRHERAKFGLSTRSHD
jgi:hypothetical protein